MTIEKGYKTNWTRDFTGNYSYTRNGETMDIVPYTEYSDLQKYVAKIKENRVKDIKPEDKIYFHKSAEFPRHKFKEIMSNPVVRKIENADYVVIGKDTLATNLRRLYSRYFYQEKGGDWTESKTSNYSGVEKQFIWPGYQSNNPHITTMEKIEELIGKKVIYDSTLNRLIPRDIPLKEGLFEKLTKMLNSSDKQNVKVGVEILNNLNYKDFRTEILMLLNQNYDNIRARGAAYGVLFKSLIDVVNKDCPHWNTGNSLGFSLGLLEGSPENPTIKKGIEDYLEGIHKLKNGRYNIEIVQNVEVQE